MDYRAVWLVVLTLLVLVLVCYCAGASGARGGCSGHKTGRGGASWSARNWRRLPLVPLVPLSACRIRAAGHHGLCNQVVAGWGLSRQVVLHVLGGGQEGSGFDSVWALSAWWAGS